MENLAPINNNRYLDTVEVKCSSHFGPTNHPRGISSLVAADSSPIKSLLRHREGETASPKRPNETPATIRLTQGYSAVVDAEDYGRVSEFKWSANVKSRGVYAVRSRCHGAPRYLHHFVMAVLDGLWVDHWNGDTLNCTKGNLRACTQTQNNRNRAPSGGRRFKGLERRGDSWRAYIYQGEKRVWLGSFGSEEDGARAYDSAAVELFGEFARLNFPAGASAA